MAAKIAVIGIRGRFWVQSLILNPKPQTLGIRVQGFGFRAVDVVITVCVLAGGRSSAGLSI